MKKKFRLLLCFVAMFAFGAACSTDDTEIPTDTEQTTDDDIIIPDGATVMMLSELSATSYPQDDDVWYITDISGSTDDFEGLRDALTDAMNYDRKISLEFPYLKEFPEYALCPRLEGYIASIISVNAPEATTIGVCT